LPIAEPYICTFWVDCKIPSVFRRNDTCINNTINCLGYINIWYNNAIFLVVTWLYIPNQLVFFSDRVGGCESVAAFWKHLQRNILLCWVYLINYIVSIANRWIGWWVLEIVDFALKGLNDKLLTKYEVRFQKTKFYGEKK
jgi:hypothetical protein